MNTDAPQLAQLLADQLRRGGKREVPAAVSEPGWALRRDGFDPERERVDEACFTLADGHVGSGGAPLAAHASAQPRVLAADVYDGEGPESHLLTAPVVFRVPYDLGPDDRLTRLLDLRAGVLYEDVTRQDGESRSARFSSLARPGTVILRVRDSGPLEAGTPLRAPTDDAVFDAGADADVAWMRVAATSGGVAAAATEERLTLPDGLVLDRFGAYESDVAMLPDPSTAVERVRRAAGIGFDILLAEHREAWSARWDDADIGIEGDDELQIGTRFALFHLMASVRDTEEAAVGARGLSGTGYRGHVFWDADTFVLPFLAATHPAAARAMLEYRLRRLPAALDAARAVGRPGARFPWESARSGRDVTPTSAQDRAGQTVAIRTGQLEDHIVAEIPWAAACYVDWSGDDEFARGPGTRLLVETARYWASRITREPDGSAHIYGVIGPDEYHEDVDDNAFTNVMARWNLRRAVAAIEAGDAIDHGVGPDEPGRWRELADAMVDGRNADTGVYEQFDGFAKLEPLIIKEVAPHRPIAADLLLGADRVHGAQVVKQADVLMAHHLVPDEMAPGTLEPNLHFYEPRTAHGSSLSPSVHASLFARAGDFLHAKEALDIASRIDLNDLTGSTAGGLHLATMGGLWQAFAFGYFGLRPRDGRLDVDPHVPPEWSALEIRVRFRGSRVRLRAEGAMLSIHVDAPVDIVLDGIVHSVGADELKFRRSGATWEVAT
jgi:trehalose/maltose hydrolase-like predicted phosphorylase